MKRLLIGSGALLFAGSVAWAATETDTFEVTATVVSACTVSASDLSFGNYDPLSATPTDATTTVSVTCSLAAPYNVGLDAGLYGTVATRQMQISGGTDKLNYVLSQDATHLVNWGNTVGTDTVALVGTGVAAPTVVYGRIAAGQDGASVGNYADTITVTVTF